MHGSTRGKFVRIKRLKNHLRNQLAKEHIANVQEKLKKPCWVNDYFIKKFTLSVVDN